VPVYLFLNDKGRRPKKTDWNNVLENNPMKEKFPPPTTNTNLTCTDISESGGSDSTQATMNSQWNNNTGLGGGQISFTAS
jgi:hypothetical protein